MEALDALIIDMMSCCCDRGMLSRLSGESRPARWNGEVVEGSNSFSTDAVLVASLEPGCLWVDGCGWPSWAWALACDWDAELDDVV